MKILNRFNIHLVHRNPLETFKPVTITDVLKFMKPIEGKVEQLRIQDK